MSRSKLPDRTGLTILHVVPAGLFGGMQKLAVDLAAAQIEHGLDVQVLALYEHPQVADYIEQSGLKYSETPGTSFNLRGCWHFLSHSRTTGPDIVHIHVGLLWSNTLGLLTKNCPSVCHAHTYMRPKDGFKAKALRLVNQRLCDAFIGVSDSVSRSVREYLGGLTTPVHTIHNGIRLSGRPLIDRPSNPQRPRYGMATRFAVGKGVTEFVEVAHAIVRRQPEARFALAGEGPLERNVRARIQQLALEDRFELPGFVSEMEGFWCSLDVAVFTAPREAFGLRILEPMALGVPVAAYRTGAGSDELIEDGRTGLQASWGDVNGLAEQCVRLATEAELRKAIVRAARTEVAARFSLYAMAEAVTNVYEETLARCGCASRVR